MRTAATPAVVVLLVVGLQAAGCGGEQAAAERAAVIRTVTQTVASTETVTATATRTQDAATACSGEGVVPRVVGLDHQLAQDTMQSAGFYNLSEEDATGAERMLLFDRNWVVVSQEPRACSTASSDTTIILRSKKKGE